MKSFLQNKKVLAALVVIAMAAASQFLGLDLSGLFGK